MKILKNIFGWIVLFSFIFSMDYGIKAVKTYANQKPVVIGYNASLPDIENSEWNNIGHKVALQGNANPYDMQLYLTKDLQMIWLSNSVADRFSKIHNPPISTAQDYFTYDIELATPYIEIISYSNVDFSNIKQKQAKNISIIVQKVFAHKTRWILAKTYLELMKENLKKDQFRDFTLDDVNILKKGNNICITFNEETINPYYELEIIDQRLEKEGITTKARKTFLEVNKPKQP